MNMKMAVVWDVAPMMEVRNTSEASVNIYQNTRRNIPGESHFQEQ
jgi:hypothetical protein